MKGNRKARLEFLIESERLKNDPEYADEYLRRNGMDPEAIASNGIALIRKLKEKYSIKSTSEKS